jgi:hypothetical protein
MEYHTAWLASNVRMNDVFTFHGQIVLTESSGSFSGLDLDDSVLPGKPPGFNYEYMNELAGFSRLRSRWWYLEGGIQQLIANDWVFDYALTYDDYDDYQRYLFVDTTGRKLGMLFRINYLF